MLSEQNKEICVVMRESLKDYPEFLKLSDQQMVMARYLALGKSQVAAYRAAEYSDNPKSEKGNAWTRARHYRVRALVHFLKGWDYDSAVTDSIEYLQKIMRHTKNEKYGIQAATNLAKLAAVERTRGDKEVAKGLSIAKQIEERLGQHADSLEEVEALIATLNEQRVELLKKRSLISGARDPKEAPLN